MRRTYRAAVLLVSAAMAVLVTACGVESGPPDLEPRSPEPPRRAPAAGSAGEWRTEYWHDTAVDVPADWWYGGGLMAGGDGSGPLACYPEPMVTPEGERRAGRGGSAPGWVGRPLSLTDVCLGDLDEGPLAESPRWPYLWFDAPLEPGTEDLGGGWTRQTVEVNGSRITVATDDAALRRRILGSATGGETCFSELERLDAPSAPAPPPLEDERPTVCAYRQTDGLPRLTYAAHLAPEQAERFVAAVDAAPPADFVGSRAWDLGGASFEWAVVYVAREVFVVRPGYHGCPHVQHGDRLVRLTPETVDPWATGGIPAVMVGPAGGKGAMIEGFIGPMG